MSQRLLNLSPIALMLAAASLVFAAQAHDKTHDQAQARSASQALAAPDSHAPIGVMAEHSHKTGEFMLSYRYSTMHMSGSRDGRSSLTPEQIATTTANRFFGRPGQPPTLRIVPTSMTMQMHMVGLMYAPNDRVTLTLMSSFIDKDMRHTTFAGGMGNQKLGSFITRVSGFGDTKIGALFPLINQKNQRLIAGFGLSLPTASITERDDVLAPNGMRPTLRLPYPMQLGSGSYELLPNITWAGNQGRFGWGAQASAMLKLDDNDENYRFGDSVKITSWASWRASPAVSISLRLEYEDQDQIDGIDAITVAPVQTADPDNQGGQWLTVSSGLNWSLGGGHRLAFELGTALYQDLNGPQLERDGSIRVGYQFSWK